MKAETVVFGYKNEGDTGSILYDGGAVLSPKQREQIKTLATQDGFSRVQFCEYSETDRPDFIGAITKTETKTNKRKTRL